jgi:hypothetical protein
MIKRELYVYLLGFSVQYHRKDLTIRLAEQYVKEKIKIDRSKLEEIYSDAKQNGRYPISIQKRLIDQALNIVKEIHAERYKV